MKPLGIASVLCVSLVSLSVAAEEGEPEMPGHEVFQRECAPCHGTGPGDDGSPTLPGTAALDAKYQGRLPGALELRSDLSAPVLRVILRRGSGAMPAFRPGELTDAQIVEIADYLAASSAANID